MNFLKNIDNVNLYISSLQSAIENINNESEDYIFLDFLNKTLNTNDNQLALLDDEFYLLKQEEKYLKFFKLLFENTGYAIVMTDIFTRIITKKEVETFINIYNTLDKKEQYFFISCILHIKPNEIMNIIKISNMDELEFFIKLAYRNNSFVDAIVLKENKCIFVPNCSYGFIMMCHDDQSLAMMKKTAEESKLFLRKIKQRV